MAWSQFQEFGFFLSTAAAPIIERMTPNYSTTPHFVHGRFEIEMIGNVVMKFM